MQLCCHILDDITTDSKNFLYPMLCSRHLTVTNIASILFKDELNCEDSMRCCRVHYLIERNFLSLLKT